MKEKIVPLTEDELEGVVGGAFNRDAVASLGLDVLTSASGKQGLYVSLQFSEGSRSPYTGNTTENGLRNVVAGHPDVSVSARTTSGEMKTLTPQELASLLS